MSDTDTRYYRIKIGDETHVFTNVFPMSNGNYSANAVWENGDIAKYYSTLSQSDINKAQIFDTFPGTEEFECKIKGYLVNAHEYDNGNYDTSGIWVDFPIMPEDKPKYLKVSACRPMRSRANTSLTISKQRLIVSSLCLTHIRSLRKYRIRHYILIFLLTVICQCSVPLWKRTQNLKILRSLTNI